MKNDKVFETLKTKPIKKEDELEMAQLNYNLAMRAMLNDPTSKDKIAAFVEANQILWEIQDKYRVARRLLLERSVSSHHLHGL